MSEARWDTSVLTTHPPTDRLVTARHPDTALGDGIERATGTRESAPTVHGRQRPVSDCCQSMCTWRHICLVTCSSLTGVILQPVLEPLFERARSYYLHSRYGTHQECDIDDDICKLASRVGLVPPPARAPGPALGDGDIASFPFDGAHHTLLRAYEDAIATVPPPNDPILMPGQLHLVAAAATGPPLGSLNLGRNGSAPSTGFGVSAERSGCQSDSYGPMGFGGPSTPSAFAIPPASNGAQNFKWLTAEYSDNGWMTWF